jgi:hypothetical protein
MKTPLETQEKMGNAWVLVSRNVCKHPLNSAFLTHALKPTPGTPISVHYAHVPPPGGSTRCDGMQPRTCGSAVRCSMASITYRFVPLASELEGWALLSSSVPAALKQSSLEGLGSHSGAPSEVDASLSSLSTNVKAELAGHCRMSYCRSCGRCTTITRPVSGVRTVGEGAPYPPQRHRTMDLPSRVCSLVLTGTGEHRIGAARWTSGAIGMVMVNMLCIPSGRRWLLLLDHQRRHAFDL